MQDSQVFSLPWGKDLHGVKLWGKWMNRREHLEPRRWKASYTKHRRAFLLISVFRRQKKTHFLKCSLEIFWFEVVKEFQMWDKGETLAWSEDNSFFLQGLGLNCRECWHSAQDQLPWPQHLLKKVELETCFTLFSYHHPPGFNHCSCVLAFTKPASRFYSGQHW